MQNEGLRFAKCTKYNELWRAVMFGITLNHTGTILNHPEPCSEPTRTVGKTMIYAKCLIQEPSWTIAGTMLNLRKPYTKTPFVLPARSPIIILNKRPGAALAGISWRI